MANEHWDDRQLTADDHEIMRMEPWLKVLLAALVPLVAAMVLPAWKVPLLGASLALLAVGVVLAVLPKKK